ncbi:GlcG/HbpS family heme-binding protein [Pseudonocardia broussonetiae]|uniref:Heme-binding protein n=1 Tax=Pseudonocardia broussonetiae TaxID=2736640 RepID=A0A6M6JPL2_9PSEU|nr:heme-binding protein [Pseudonocardia broussonetiae]QJY48887.1 heme-binding protein [Pseudonocardia broussonetiae]
MSAPTQNLTRGVVTLSHDGAEKLIGATVAAAREAGLPVSVAVHDSAANLLAFLRMDGAPELTIGIAQDKSYTAAAFGAPTHQLHEVIKDDEPLRLGFVHTPRVVTFGGGFPLVSEGLLVGGIGVSGGHYSQDVAVVEAALKATGFTA